jgi:hypothetical protein
MASVNKNEKTKGGKPKAGMSALASAEAATLETVRELVENPQAFVIFRVIEATGVPKTGAQDFIIRAVRADGTANGREVNLIVPEVFLKKRGKHTELLMPEMGVADALLVVKPRMVTRERLSHVASRGGGGAHLTIKVTETDWNVAGAMVVDAARARELPPTVMQMMGRL